MAQRWVVKILSYSLEWTQGQTPAGGVRFTREARESVVGVWATQGEAETAAAGLREVAGPGATMIWVEAVA